MMPRSQAPGETPTSPKPYAVLYRWTVDPACEEEFRRRWREATIELRDGFGALGSCLSRDAEGAFVAFARWPGEEHRDRAFAERGPVEPWSGILTFEMTKLWVEDDLLTA